jgi:uncharacterized PurR-regulated membrane protein YhhQ (DUF165 family)
VEFVERYEERQSLRLLWMGFVALDVFVLDVQSLLLPRPEDKVKPKEAYKSF